MKKNVLNRAVSLYPRQGAIAFLPFFCTVLLGKWGYPTPENAILHPILHPKASVNTGRFGNGCRKCRIFSKTFFEGKNRRTCKNLCFRLLPFAIKFLCCTFVFPKSYSNVRECISKAIKLYTPFGVQRIFWPYRRQGRRTWCGEDTPSVSSREEHSAGWSHRAVSQRFLSGIMHQPLSSQRAPYRSARMPPALEGRCR